MSILSSNMGLTTRTLETLNPGQVISDRAPRGSGQLTARALKGGAIQLYFRYINSEGKRDALPLGKYDKKGLKGLSLDAARIRVSELRGLQAFDGRDLRMTLEARERQAKAEAEARKVEASRLSAATLGALMNAYVEMLKQRGKISWKDVDSAVRVHVETVWPEFWDKPASQVTVDDVMLIIERVVEAGKLRTANKLRSHLHAAFNAAIRARTDARLGTALRSLQIRANPVRDVASLEGVNNPGDARDTLDEEELRNYWDRIKDMPPPYGPMLRFHLLTGCQRPAQLARAVVTDHKALDRVVILRDPKGRRKQPRLHAVPLTALAQKALQDMRGGEAGEFLFTISRGRKGATATTIRDGLDPLIEDMYAKGEIKRPRFTAKVLRRTVETRLAALKIPPHVRGQLQSHGLGGVQAAHYDMHDYFEEKLDAQEQLARLLGAGP